MLSLVRRVYDAVEGMMWLFNEDMSCNVQIAVFRLAFKAFQILYT